MPLALHWYVWDEIAFDTGYPEYFPAKPGFAAAVQTLQQQYQISVAPYINGRIFDVNTKSWTQDGAEAYCTKYSPVAFQSDIRTPYQEVFTLTLLVVQSFFGFYFGFIVLIVVLHCARRHTELRFWFDVCCDVSYTSYWQQKIASVVA